MSGPREWSGRRVVVVGGGRSGVAAGHLLADLGAEVVLTDLRPAGELPGVHELERRGVRLACGGHPGWLWEGADAAVVSPGIEPGAPPLEAARQRGVPLLSEVELATPFLTGTVIAVTGSNGKSTVTSMVGELLAAGGIEAAVCGNIGVPVSAAVRRQRAGLARYDAFVVELSSFQCETVEAFHPHLAAILNLCPDHLDRHGSFDAYADAKLRLLRNCTAEDWVVYDDDDPELRRRLPAGPARPVPFRRGGPPPSGPAAWLQDGAVTWRDPAGRAHRVLSLEELPLLGPHNAANACAATALAALAGVSPAQAAAGLRRCRALEHRTEACGTVDGVLCVNDSKATNVEAVRAALAGFRGGIWLILGGRDKGADFRALRPLLAGRVVRVLLIGEAAPRIAAALDGAAPLQQCGTLERAVGTALGAAAPGQVLLLSPACTSFDQYENFEARGRHFKELVAARATAPGAEQRTGAEQGAGARSGRG